MIILSDRVSYLLLTVSSITFGVVAALTVNVEFLSPPGAAWSNRSIIVIGVVLVSILQIGSAVMVLRSLQAAKRHKEYVKILLESQSLTGMGSFVLDVAAGNLEVSEMVNIISGLEPSRKYSQEEYAQIIHPNWREEMLRYFNEDVMTLLKPLNKQYKIIRPKDGSERWMHTKARFEFDRRGKPLKLFGTIQDITQQKQIEEALRESERRFRAVLENVTLAAVILDMHGSITFCNDFLLSITGWEREEVLDKNWFDRFIPCSERQNARQIFYEGIDKREVEVHFENTIAAKNGGFRIIAWSNILLEDENGNVIGVTSIGEDVTERKKAEVALRKNEIQLRELMEGLEAKVRNRTSQLEESNQQLESFSYSISHDLRAPIRAIDSFSKIVLDEETKSLSPDGKRNLTIVRKNTQRMGRMVDDLLQFSRTSRAELKKMHFDMEPLTAKVLEEALKLEPQRKFSASIQALPKAYGDPSLLRQVWMNLISNAVKFTRERQTSQITIGGDEEENRSIFWITDNGSGFDMRYAEKLFGVFQRLHSQQEYEGSGVGLAIVNRILQRHGGKIWAKGEVDCGSTFSFYLPK